MHWVSRNRVNHNASDRIILYLAVVFAAGLLSGVVLQRFYPVGSLLRAAGVLRNPTSAPLPTPPPIVSDRIAVSVNSLSGKRLMVGLAFGQSNSANYGETLLEPGDHVLNFYQGNLYLARDPLLGADGNGGSVWTRLGQQLVSADLYDEVVFISIGLGSTDIARWAPGGDLHGSLLEAIDQAHAQGLGISHLLWQQGEADAALGTKSDQYKRLFMEMLMSIRQRGVDAPIYVAVSTRCQKERGNREIQHALRSVVDPVQGIFAGPDTDLLGFAYRFDGCHFSDEGLTEAAKMWFQAISGTRNN